jgi:hypothetical protein
MSYVEYVQPAAGMTTSASAAGSVEMATAVAQLTRDLAASEERENDIREQLKFAEQVRDNSVENFVNEICDKETGFDGQKLYLFDQWS